MYYCIAYRVSQPFSLYPPFLSISIACRMEKPMAESKLDWWYNWYKKQGSRGSQLLNTWHECSGVLAGFALTENPRKYLAENVQSALIYQCSRIFGIWDLADFQTLSSNYFPRIFLWVRERVVCTGIYQYLCICWCRQIYTPIVCMIGKLSLAPYRYISSGVCVGGGGEKEWMIRI